MFMIFEGATKAIRCIDHSLFKNQPINSVDEPSQAIFMAQSATRWATTATACSPSKACTQATKACLPPGMTTSAPATSAHPQHPASFQQAESQPSQPSS